MVRITVITMNWSYHCHVNQLLHVSFDSLFVSIQLFWWYFSCVFRNSSELLLTSFVRQKSAYYIPLKVRQKFVDMTRFKFELLRYCYRCMIFDMNLMWFEVLIPCWYWNLNFAVFVFICLFLFLFCGEYSSLKDFIHKIQFYHLGSRKFYVLYLFCFLMSS